MVIRKMFSFIEKVFQPSSGSLGLIFCDFSRKLIWDVIYLTGIRKNVFFDRKNVFQNL